MKKHTNFYETVKEAEMRLLNTIVLYEGKPYYVLAIDNHRNDGIFRIYLDDMSHPEGSVLSRFHDIPYEWVPYEPGHPPKGVKLDEWMEKHPDSGLIRKMMNSPHFNNYRPFPLGMMNFGGGVGYLERSPQRHTQQGLTANMVVADPVSLEPTPSPLRRGSFRYRFISPEMTATILGDYPSAEECLKNLLNPEIANTAAAFHRLFALVRGPIDTMFLAYKTDIVGILCDNDFSKVRVAKNFRHTKELIEGLKLFDKIIID